MHVMKRMSMKYAPLPAALPFNLRNACVALFEGTRGVIEMSNEKIS
jgi:hypothetical protein